MQNFKERLIKALETRNRAAVCRAIAPDKNIYWNVTEFLNNGRKLPDEDVAIWEQWIEKNED